MSSDRDDLNTKPDKRKFNRFDVRKQSVEVEIILNDYKRVRGLATISNLSLGGLGVMVKEAIPMNSNIKFHLGKSKTIFHATIIWCHKIELESLPYSAGISFTFPYADEAQLQKKELVEFVYKTLNRMTRSQLVDRLMNLFIERRRIVDVAQDRIGEARSELQKTQNQTRESLDRAHNIIDYNLAGVVYFDAEYNMIYSNAMAEKILKYPSEEIKELPLHNIVHENTEKMIKRYFSNSNTNVYNGTVIDKNGNKKSVRWRVFATTLQNREALCFMFILNYVNSEG